MNAIQSKEIKNLLDRVKLFDDTYDLIEALEFGMNPNYYMPEAATHIDGLYVLVKDLSKQLKALAKENNKLNKKLIEMEVKENADDYSK